MAQYALSLTLAPVFSEDNFVVSECNQEAHAWIHKWPHWPDYLLILYGPSGSGKTHLAHIWAQRSGADVHDTVKPEINGHLLLENIERIQDEESLLHLINYSRENRHCVLMTSSVAPKKLPFTLPDLTSRLRALSSVYIAPPDDDVLAGAMRKQFADRQLKVEDEVVSYLTPRMDRSFTAVKEMVEKLDAASMREQKNITIPFAKKLLDW